ncbi:MAG: TonB-dependent receptor [Dysgonamonadaceae bacterium]|jgi:TonB-linked SusC/RagA family outer membrane protein|nr:TonB-dependent receptor [Dysgonamonadaceae bacterium]
MKNKYLLSFLLAALCNCQLLFAQNTATIKGTVVDEHNEPLIGVSVVVKNQPGIGTSTDIDGHFTLKTGIYETLVFTFLGYEKQEVQLAGKTEINVQLNPAENSLDEVVVVGAGTQRKVSVTGAITTVDVKQLKVPTASITNALAGNVAGIIAMQRSGEPGQNFSEFWVRGISTFGANASALVLVDGVERNLNEVNVEDIESFSVLKDASATAIYGQRGANGVVIIQTKRGEEGKVKINFKGEYGMSTPAMMPQYVDAMTYATLANEARISRYQKPMYDESELEIIKSGLDPDLYPNVNWYDHLLNDITHNYRASVNISGGSPVARYYISGSYYNEEGLYKVNSLNAYNTNANYERYNFRSNVDVDVTKTTKVELGIGGWLVNQNKPGAVSDDIWGSLAGLTPLTVPIVYSNGLYPTYGSSGIYISPQILLTETGYKSLWENKIESNVGLTQKLDFLTKGLNAMVRFSFDAYNYHDINRLKMPDLYRASKQRDYRKPDAPLVLTRVLTGSPLNQSMSTHGDRRYFGEAQINYDRLFGETHRVSALLRSTMEEYTTTKIKSRNDAEWIKNAIPHRYLAYAARLTYNYADRYFLEGNFGYTGSENFEKGNQFGAFPAISAGWMISNEPLLKSLTWLDQLKVRYSYGLTGNDAMKDGEWDIRFAYLTQINTAAGGFTFGDIGQTRTGGTSISFIGAQNLTWEVSAKHDAGIDLNLFNNKFSLIADVFKDTRDRIFMARRYIPYTVGIENIYPWANVGRMESKGADGTVAFQQKIGEVNMTLRGNFTYSYSKVIDYDEEANALDYQMTKGYRWGQTRGLVALGLFKDEKEIAESPKQFEGDVLPGDIKYKDVNGDGVINEADIVPIGYSTIPGIVYGFGTSLQWKGFDLNVLFQGSGNCDFFLSGVGAHPFAGGEFGNILKAVSDPEDRWISREISGTPNTENPNAIFPRLSYGSNNNNFYRSTYWLRNSRYLRLKNLEIGYTLPKRISRNWMMDSVRIYCIGTNLLIFSPFDYWDPELASDNGAKYPISKTVTFGLTVSF